MPEGRRPDARPCDAVKRLLYGMLSPTRSGFRRLLLLYQPVRRRAWIPRVFFYLTVFLLLPFSCLLALGAYVGPEQTLGGLPVVAVIVMMAFSLRAASVFADGSLRPGRGATANDGALDHLTFTLQEPPPRRPLQGVLASIAGTVLLLAGVYGLGRIADRGLKLRERGRRLRAVDARTLLRDRPGDPPVLLLRSFAEEETREARPLSLLMRRYEESLSRSLSKYGPVITIGRPGDALGFLGAGRLYVSDPEWQQAVRHFMRHAGAVVVIVGQTEGLWWEIAEVFTLVARERLLFIFPYSYVPQRSGSGTKSEFYVAWKVPRPLRDLMDRERRERYQKFRERVAGLIPEDLPPELGRAICLDFAADGRVRLLGPRYHSVGRYMLGPLGGTNVMADLFYRRYRFNMARTVWPFVEKLYETTG